MSLPPLPAPAELLALTGVRRTFVSDRGEHTALEGVTLRIHQGEFVCLLGPSGCGKSTLLSLLAGLERPDGGTVTAHGGPLGPPDPKRAIIFQDHALFPWRTVAGNVAYPLERLSWPRARIRARVAELLGLVHLTGHERAWIHQLSGGMRQRVALARALACGPEVLLMDEPFAALDAMTRAGLLEEVQRLWRSLGTTVVFVTHDVREAAAVATRIAVMASRPGRLLEVVELAPPEVRGRTKEELEAVVERVTRLWEAPHAPAESQERRDVDAVAPDRLDRAAARSVGAGL